MFFEVHLLRQVQDLDRFGTRNDHHAIAVSGHNVTWSDRHAVALQRHLASAESVVMHRGRWDDPRGVYRKVDFAQLCDITITAIDKGYDVFSFWLRSA